MARGGDFFDDIDGETPWRRLGVIQCKLPGLACIVERRFARRFEGMPVAPNVNSARFPARSLPIRPQDGAVVQLLGGT
jgi:hypothetical protein